MVYGDDKMITKIKRFWPFVFVKVNIKASGTWAYNYVDTEGLQKAISEAVDRALDHERRREKVDA